MRNARPQLFNSWKDIRKTITVSLVLSIVLLTTSGFLYGQCSFLSIAFLFLGAISLSVLVISLSEIRSFSKYDKDRKARLLLVNELEQKTKEKSDFVKKHFPHAYAVYKNDMSVTSGSHVLRDLFDVSYTKRLQRVLDVSNEEWVEREARALEEKDRNMKYREIQKYIEKYPLAFYKYCKYQLGVKFNVEELDILLPGDRNPDTFKTYKNTFDPQTKIVEYSSFPTRKSTVYGTKKNYFPKLHPKYIDIVYSSLNSLVINDLEEEENKLRSAIEHENILIKYNFEVFNVNNRDQYVEDFLSYMEIKEDKMLYIINHLKELDIYVELQKEKSK